jgi:cellulase (glycosyl hydrolase family 5)
MARTIAALTTLLWLSTAGLGATETSRGLAVRDGQLLLQGKPYRGVGVNYFSLASRLLNNPADNSSLTNLSALAKAHIPFVRFMCGGFWPAEQRLYLTNRNAFFQRLDQVVRCAEQNQVGLVPSLFWNLATLSDLAHEPIQELGNTNSQSMALLVRYTADVVDRYRNSPAIWAWEFANEPALSADLPNAAEQRPPILPDLGTPPRRTERDELRSSDLAVAYVEFARTIKRLDSTRPIFSGNALPRASAWHNTHERNWKADTLEQFREILRRDNPDPMGGISVHIYPNTESLAGTRSVAETISMVAQAAKTLGKPLFIGEFGVSRQAGTAQAQKRLLSELLTAIAQANVPLAAVWVFDFAGQDSDWNITFQNDRSWALELISEVNQRRMP